MKRITSINIVQETKNEIRRACAAGTWESKLPGSRILAERLNVSAPTVIKALRELAEEGILYRAGDRKAYSFTGKAESSGSGDDKQGRVIVLSPVPFTDLPGPTQDTTNLLIHALRKKGMNPERKVIDFTHSKSVPKNWETLMEADEETPLIAIRGNSVLEKWVTTKSIPTLFLGGSLSGSHVSMVAVHLIPMVKHAMTELTALGHQHIVLPLHDRTDEFSASIKAATRAALESVGARYTERYHNPESAYAFPEVTQGMLESVFAIRQPTAMIFLGFNELLVAYCFLSRMGLRVPEDISLVLLSHQEEVDWFLPKLAHHRYPNEAIVKQICKWAASSKKQQLLSYPSARYVPGNSTAAPTGQKSNEQHR